MVEKDPRVTPLFRLPQLPTEGRAHLSALPQPKQTPLITAPPPAEEDDEFAEELDELEEEERAAPHPLRSEISGEQARLSSDTGGLRVAASSILKRALLNFAEQDRHRSQLLLILLAAQAAVLVALLPGYLFWGVQLSGVLVVVVGLALYGGVWLCHRFGRTWEACYLLVFGGEALAVADLLLSAAHQLTLETLLTSLLFLLVILASGILFSPETALIFALLSAGFTTLVLLIFPLSAPLGAAIAGAGRYLALVSLALAQVGVGVVAWLFGRKMQESVHVVTYLAGMEMTNKRLRKRLRQAMEKKRHLETGVAMIQQTHARVAAGDYAARAHVEGDLLPLAVSLNLMLDRVESFVHGEYERERMETAAAGLAELAGRVAQGTVGPLPAPTGTALDGLSIAIKQMQTDINQRLVWVHQSASVLMNTVGRCEERLLPVAEALVEHLRSMDALVLAADNVMTNAQRQIEFATRAGTLLLTAAPPNVHLHPAEADNPLKPGTSALRLAEEMERRLGAGAGEDKQGGKPSAEMGDAQLEPATIEQANEATETVLPEGLPAAALAASIPDEDTSAEADTSLETPTEGGALKDVFEDGMTPGQIAAVAMIAEGSPVFVPTEVASAAEAAEPETTSAESGAPPAAEALPRITLADVDREAAEEAAALGPSWNLEQLQELAGVLADLAGEATQQERHARTLNYKLRLMLQGMPDARRVDMTEAWLRAALGAINQSANQVRLASKAVPTSAFSASNPPNTEAGERK